MSYSSENGGLSAADMAAVLGNNGNGNGFFGADGLWWLIILLLFSNNGWGYGFGGSGMLPFMMGNQGSSEVQRGFDQNAIMSGLSGINTSLANAEISRCNAQANVLQALNTNQAALTAGMNAIASSLQNCCCENRSNIADLKYTVATENCADRTALNEGLRDLMMANTANTQSLMNTMTSGIQTVMDKICQLELDGKNAQIAELQAQLNEANRRASQNDQTAQILASQAAQTSALEQYLAPTPRPAYIVQNPNCCSQNFGCGCGA